MNLGPNLSVRQEDGSFTRALNYPIEVINPLAQIAATNNLTEVDKIGGVFGVNYKFLTDFGNIGSNTVFDRELSEVGDNITFFRDYTFDAFLDYEKVFIENHNVKATVGTSVFKSTNNRYGRTGIDLPGGSSDINDAASIVDNFQFQSSREFDSRLLSYFARVQYNYKQKYLFSALIRRDGSTNFGPKNKFGTFNAFSLGWVVSDEFFMEDINFVSFMKFRASYGVLGNDRIPSFRFASLLNGEATYTLNDGLVFGRAIGPIANPEIQWEEQESLDFGLDLRLFNNKVDITADYYRKSTKGLLLEVEASRILGNTAPGARNPIVNAGSVKNEGFEFQIGYRDQINDNLKFNISYNIATLKNEEEGQPIGVFYGYQTNGIFQNQAEVDAHPSQLALGANAQPGDLRFVDLNNDNVIDDKDRTHIGDPIPSATMGLNLGVDYKNFDFQTYLFASIGNDIVRNYDRNDPITNQTSYVLDRWRGEGSSNTTPRVTNGATSNNVFSDYFVEDMAKNFKIKESKILDFMFR